jgi:site-specific recombinase XerD
MWHHGLSGRETPTHTAESTAARLRRQSLAPTTLRAYEDQVRRFSEWCDSQGLQPENPADQDETLSRWVAGRFEDGASPSTIAQGLAAVRFAARSSGAPDPAGPETAATMRGIRRAGWSRGTGQVKGMRWAEVEAAAAAAARDGSAAGLRDAALLRLGSDALLRVSEMIAVNCGDLEPADDGSAVLRIRRSKTDPAGRGATVYVGRPSWLAIRAWVTAVGYVANDLASRGAVARLRYGASG